MSKTKKISLSVKKKNEDYIDLLDTYADKFALSRSDFVFKLVSQYHCQHKQDLENA